MTVATDAESCGVPAGWCRAPIRDVFELNPRKPRPDEYAGTMEVTFVPMPAVDADAGVITKPLIRRFEEVRKGFTSFRNDDVIVAKITPCFENGKSAICRELLNDVGFGSTEFHVLRSMGAVLPRYIYHFVRQESVRRDGAENMTGSVGQKRVPADWLGSIELPIPPLAEQRRIVAKVEELLARVNAARERLAKVPAILKRFRQSVLAAACSGRLTERWRNEHPDVESGDALLARMAEERRTRWSARNFSRKYVEPEDVASEELSELPPTWSWTNFDHCSWEITVGHVGPMRNRYVDEGIPFLRSQNVRPLRFEAQGLVFITSVFHAALRKSALDGGELLVTRSGANTGDCCVYPATAGPANCADLVVTRALSGLLPEYGGIYVASPDGQAKIGLRQTGMAQPHFNIGAMRVKPFALPPLAEQHEIVRQVGALLALADKIEARVHAATARVEKITQAILAKAFRGKLVPTEAELARLEGRDYEAAPALLDRIRAARATNGASDPPLRPRRAAGENNGESSSHATPTKAGKRRTPKRPAARRQDR